MVNAYVVYYGVYNDDTQIITIKIFVVKYAIFQFSFKISFF